MLKVRIVWNGQGGELDSITINNADETDCAVTDALIELIRGNIVAVGDSFTVEEL